MKSILLFILLFYFHNLVHAQTPSRSLFCLGVTSEIVAPLEFMMVVVLDNKNAVIDGAMILSDWKTLKVESPTVMIEKGSYTDKNIIFKMFGKTSDSIFSFFLNAEFSKSESLAKHDLVLAPFIDKEDGGLNFKKIKNTHTSVYTPTYPGTVQSVSLDSNGVASKRLFKVICHTNDSEKYVVSVQGKRSFVYDMRDITSEELEALKELAAKSSK